jgi:hypothetical protein
MATYAMTMNQWLANFRQVAARSFCSEDGKLWLA